MPKYNNDERLRQSPELSGFVFAAHNLIFDLFHGVHIQFIRQEMLNLAIKYNKAVQEEDELPAEKLAIANVGRQDAKKHLEEHVSNLMSSNIVQTLGTMLDTVVF
ncbi:hypothetical protein OsI_01311 [Oryza sativa Indica Group]|uniref:26S proteasome regulatory subunit RPN11 C-terminal domain-containing protein n=1 Tax=Oryza sativa subsp. indica TaxID=39946 RepID=A2WN85_ORYSI|nr:hypothetical protein OsI_01311 [Oryza sativa Indica Group]